MTTETTTKSMAFDRRGAQLSATMDLLNQELWALHDRVGPGGDRYESSAEQHAVFARMGEIAQAVEHLKSAKRVVSQIASTARRDENI